MSQEKECEDIPEFGAIDVSAPEERRHWAKAFGTTEGVLLKAAKLVGTSISELRKLFCRDEHKPGDSV